MTNIINLERDMQWFDMEEANVGLAAAVSTASTWAFAALGDVFQRVGYVNTTWQANAAVADGLLVAGVRMLEPPELEYVPYRVIGSAVCGSDIGWFVGFDDGGSVMSGMQRIGAGPVIDTVVALRGVSSGSGDAGKNLVFAAGLARDDTSKVQVHLSVQRMIAKPPQYASASS